MPFTIKFFFSFIFLFGIFSSSKGTGLKCDSLYASGKYFEASIAYEQMIFNAGTGADLNYLRYKKALCYKQLKYFDRALDELQPIHFSNPADSLFLYVSYLQSLCHYLNGEPEKALWKIDEYFHRSPDTASFQLLMPIRLFCLNETHQWAESRKCFESFLSMQNLTPEKVAKIEQVVDSLYESRNLPRIKSSRKAENWSRFLPGSGQIYAGKAGEGIANFLINASLLGFSAQQFYNGFYITGYFAGLGFFNKTYHGGIKRAGILADQKNKEQIATFNSHMNAIIRSDLTIK